MTYILGARCTDGVVMVADRRITIDGGRAFEFSDKLISNLKSVVIGFSGSNKKFNLFKTKLLNYVEEFVRDDPIIVSLQLVKSLMK